MCVYAVWFLIPMNMFHMKHHPISSKDKVCLISMMFRWGFASDQISNSLMSLGCPWRRSVSRETCLTVRNWGGAIFAIEITSRFHSFSFSALIQLPRLGVSRETKNHSQLGNGLLVDRRRFELLTSAMRMQRSTSWASGPWSIGSYSHLSTTCGWYVVEKMCRTLLFVKDFTDKHPLSDACTRSCPRHESNMHPPLRTG